MKVAIVVFVFGVVALESTYSQCLPSVLGAPAITAPAIATPAILTSNSVAASLADTLSLLTVSSLLSEKLPLGYPTIAPVAPYAPVAPCAPAVATVAPVSGCGCGCSSYGYPYGPYVI